MKRIGTTENGDVLLQATPDEYKRLLTLKAVLEDRSLWTLNIQREMDNRFDADFAPVFGVISTWVIFKDRAKEMKTLIDAFDQQLNPPERP